MDLYPQKYEKSFQEQEQVQILTKEVSNIPSNTFSEFYNLYENFLRQFPANENLSSYKDLFQENGILYQTSKHEKGLNITVLHKSKNSQVFTLYVSFSQFTFEIKLLNLAIRSQFGELGFVGQGTFGSVCTCKLYEDSENFVIKHINYENRKKITNKPIGQTVIKKKLNQAILQYCFCKLFSVLKIGSYVSNFLGFDIVVFNDSIQFTMEMCEQFHQKTLKRDLCHSLKLMHSLDIIHGDIKLDNIMWSPKYKKNVFIDFGLSLLLKQKVGQKTLTHFFGTFGYSSPQMRQAYNRFQMIHVDLYYNDLYGLIQVFQKSTLEEMEFRLAKQIKQIKKKKENHQQYLNYINFLLNIRLMSLIYEGQKQQIYEFLKKSKNLNIEEQTMMLFLQLQPTSFLEKISDFFIQTYNIPKQIQNKLALHFKKKFILSQPDKHLSELFQSRIQEIQSCFIGGANNIMIFTMLLSKQNTAPSAAFHKTLYFKAIQQLDPTNPQFWRYFVQASYNLYTTPQEYELIFDKMRIKLRIRQSQSCPYKQFENFVKFHKIAQIAMKQYHINLFQEYNILHHKFFSETLIQILENQKSCSMLPDKMKEFIKSFINLRQSGDTEHNLSQLKTIINLNNNLCKQLKLIGHNQEQEQGINYYFQKYYKLVYKSIQKQIPNFIEEENFLSLFSRFEPAKKIFELAKIKYNIILRRMKADDEKITELKHFFKNISNLSYNKYFYMQFHSIYLCNQLRKHFRLNSLSEYLMKMINQYEMFFPNDSYFPFLHNFLELSYMFCQAVIHNNLQIFFKVVQYKVTKKNYELTLEQFKQFFQMVEILPFHQRHQNIDTFLSKVIEKFDEKFPNETRIYIIWSKIAIQTRYHLFKDDPHNTKTKKFIKENYQLLLSNNNLLLCQQIIIRSFEYSRFNHQFPQNQFQLLRNFAFSQEKRVFIECNISECLGECYGVKIEQNFLHFNDFFNVLLSFLNCSKTQAEENLRFITYVFIKIFIDRFLLFTSEGIVGKIIAKFYNVMVQLYRKNHQQFLHLYSNAIIIIQCLFCHTFSILKNRKIKEPNLFPNLIKLLKLASYWISYSLLIFQRKFESCMNFLAGDMVSKTLFLSTFTIDRKKSILHLKALRNPQFIIDTNLIQILFHKFNKSKQKSFHSLAVFQLKQKLQSIITNKSSPNLINNFSKLLIVFNKYHSFEINKQNPYLNFNHFNHMEKNNIH